MRKSIVLMLIATLILGALMVSCNSDVSEGTNGGDKLVEVTISGGSTSKGISAVGSMENADAYYWYYKAGKNDSSVYRTGQTVAVTSGALGAGGWKAVKANNAAGLTNSNLGYFSTGDWLFSFVAYKKVATFNGDAATNGNDTLVPVYYQYNLAVKVDSTTISRDSTDDRDKVFITVTPNVGKAQGDAVLKFPTTGLNWSYSNNSGSGEAATITALNGTPVKMVVYYVLTGTTTEVPIAQATGTIAGSGSTASANFSVFNGKDGDGNFTLDEVTVPSSYSGTNYTLKFKVITNDGNAQELGATTTQSVTAYTGGTITITSTGTAAIDDNEVQYEVVVSDIEAVVSTDSETGASTSSATITAAEAPTVTEPTSVGTEHKETQKQDSEKKTIVSTATVVEASADKNTSVIIPAAGLEATTVTKTLESKADNDNKTVVTETTSSTHNLEMELTPGDSVQTSTSFSIQDSQAKIAGIDLTLTKTTTTVTITDTTVSGTTTTTSSTVTDAAETVHTFNKKYVTVSTYIESGLSGVSVVYDGADVDGYNLVFDSNSNSPSIEKASSTSDATQTGTGYDPTTGLLVFKTNHFSNYVVTSSVVAQIGDDKYIKLQDAVDAVTNGQTIKLVNNVDSVKAVIVDKSGVCFTLDLNNYSISNSIDMWGDTADTWCLILMKNGTLTITDNSSQKGGSLVAKENDCYAIDILGGTLNIEKGLYNGNISAVQVQEGTLNISGGTFKIQQLAGNVTEDKHRYTINCIDSYYKNHTAIVNITGGTFYNFNPENNLAEGANTNFVADGYCAKSNQDGTWTVWANCTHPDSSHVSYIVNSTDKTKHDVICGYCGGVIRSELHEYNSEDTHKCIKCAYESITYHVSPDATSTTFSLSQAIDAYNSNTNQKIDYIIELEPGIYNVPVGTYIIKQTKENAGSTLKIKAKDMETATKNWNVILRPTGVTNTGNLFFFSVSGGSSYSNGGSILFEGLTFDMSDSEYAKDSYSSARLFGVYCSSGNNIRYAHDITINNCKFIGCGGKFASAVGANNSNSSPSGITVSNCMGDKLNCWFNGYVGDGAGFGLNLKNLRSNNFLCLLNNQSSAPTITIDNVDGSFFYDLSGDGFSTEFAVVYTIGGRLDIRNCEWELVAKPTQPKEGEPAFVNGKSLIGNLTITTSNNTVFTNKTGVTLSNVYDLFISNRNSKQLEINGSKTEDGSKSFSLEFSR